MKCAVCRGACCERLTIGVDLHALPDDTRRWVLLHAEATDGDQVTLPCPCLKLTAEGRCDIYERRPGMCHDFVAGGPDCLTTVRRRRTPAEYQQIRDAADPRVLA